MAEELRPGLVRQVKSVLLQQASAEESPLVRQEQKDRPSLFRLQQCQNATPTFLAPLDPVLASGGRSGHHPQGVEWEPRSVLPVECHYLRPLSYTEIVRSIRGALNVARQLVASATMLVLGLVAPPVAPGLAARGE